MPEMRRPSLRFLALACALSAAVPGHAQVVVAQGPSLADLSLEELANVRVTTATLRSERLSDAPASIFVITGEDIRRSGARSIAEALRLAPNLEVAQVSASSYAITARGFQNVITNKLLVLLDGRALYTTVLSGVLWDAQDLMLEDVERIEVISGPGAALYGANAFTGVINIITKRAQDTQGALVSAGASNVDRTYAARYGGKLGRTSAWRGYVMHIERDNLRPFESHVPDDLAKDQIGLRADFGPPDRGFTVQGDAYHARETGNGGRDIRLDGSNILARWTAAQPGGGKLEAQAFYSNDRRDDPAGFVDRVATFDAQVKENFAPFGAHRVSFVAGYRYARDDTTPTPIVRFIPEDRNLHWASVAAQDEIALARNLSLIAGARWQTDVFVNPVFLPDLRLAWKPAPDHLVWASASRVARTPGRVDRDLFFPGNEPFFIRGGPDFESETGDTYEIGYRGTPGSRLTVSLTGFYTRLDDLRGGRLAPGGGAFIANTVEGHTSGIQAWVMCQAAPRWRLMAGLLELHQDLRDKSGNGDLNGPANLGNDPRHTLKLRSSWRVTDMIDMDIDWRYVSSLAYLTTVPAYSATDVRIGYRPTRDLEISVTVSNLFDRDHVEFDEHGFPAEIPRSTYGQVRWYF
jgi:iron complex outermembrane receptor protein